MPYTDPTDTIVCKLTDVGRQYHARSVLGQLSFTMKGFSVGRYGYQDANPVKIINVNTADTALTDPVYPPAGYTSYYRLEEPMTGVLAVVCRIDRTSCFYGLGEIGLWAQVEFCTTPPPNAGDVFLYALGHMPMKAKADNQEVDVFRIILTY